MAREFSADTVQLATRIPKSLHVRVRVAALDAGVTLAEWLDDALTAHLARTKRARRNQSGTATKRAEQGPSNAA